VGVPRRSSQSVNQSAIGQKETLGNSSFDLATTPTPNPSPQGGGEHTDSASKSAERALVSRFRSSHALYGLMSCCRSSLSVNVKDVVVPLAFI
jgi:hypothetical protein